MRSNVLSLPPQQRAVPLSCFGKLPLWKVTFDQWSWRQKCFRTIVQKLKNFLSTKKSVGFISKSDSIKTIFSQTNANFSPPFGTLYLFTKF